VVDPLTGETLEELDELVVFPATHYVAGDERCGSRSGKIEPSCRSGWEFEERASCSRRSACACAPSTTSR
jgi:excinuclease UvrABC helicase subunit UvrB